MILKGDALLSLAFSAWDVFADDCGKHLAWFRGERAGEYWKDVEPVGREVI